MDTKIKSWIIKTASIANSQIARVACTFLKINWGWSSRILWWQSWKMRRWDVGGGSRNVHKCVTSFMDNYLTTKNLLRSDFVLRFCDVISFVEVSDSVVFVSKTFHSTVPSFDRQLIIAFELKNYYFIHNLVII